MIEIGGFVGLAALFVVIFALLRREVQFIRADLRDAFAERPSEPKDDIAALREGQAELREGMAELRERMVRLEGVLDGLREAITWRAGPRDAA